MLEVTVGALRGPLISLMPLTNWNMVTCGTFALVIFFQCCEQ